MSIVYEAALAKVSQLRKKDETTLRAAEVEQELAFSKKEFNFQSLDFVFSLNTLEAKRKYDFVEKITAFAYANLAYFHQGFVCVS